MRVYARIAIGVLNAAFVVIVGAVALAVTANVALDTLNDNGNRHVLALGRAATAEVNHFFAGSEKVSMGMVDLARMVDSFPLPAEHPTRAWTPAQLSAAGLHAGGAAMDTVQGMWWGLLAEAEFVPISLMVWLNDGSRVVSLPISGTRRYQMMELMFQNSTTSPAQGGVPLDRTIRIIEPAARRIVPRGELPTLDAQMDQRDAFYPRFDFRFPPLSGAYLRAANHTVGAAPQWSAVRYFNDGSDQTYMYAASALYNRTGFHLGYAFTSVLIGGIGEQLQHVVPSQGSQLFVVNGDGFLLGATSGIEISNTSALNRSVPLGPGCTSTDVSRGSVASVVDLLSCLHHASNSGSAELRYIARSGLLHDGVQQKIKTGGSVYYARVQKLTVQLSGLVVVVVPESEILGDVQKTITIAAASTAAVVFVAAFLSFFAVWAMLHPLQGIAVRMGKAARLEDDPAEVDDSLLVEIGDLQRAFKQMRDELTRIRAFVPQALLRVSTSEDDDADEVEAFEASGVQHHSSMSHSSRPTMGGNMSLSSLSNPTRHGHGSEHSERSGKGSGKELSVLDHGESSRYTPSTVLRRGQNQRTRGAPRTVSGTRTDIVSVLAVNLRGFHSATSRGVAADRVAATVEAVLRETAAEKGVVDSFHGDRFVVTFNAARPAANHGIRATVAAVRVCAALRSGDGKNFSLPVTCGVASGTAHIGNLGSDTMKRFSVIGAVFTQATILERMCKLYPGAQCLVSQRLFEDLRTAVSMRTVDYIRLPFAKAPCLVADVVREHAMGDDAEWMYQLQGAAASQAATAPTAVANEAWTALVSGDVSQASSVIQGMNPSACSGDPVPDAAVHEAAKRRLLAVIGEAGKSGSVPAPSSLGPFYDEACAPTPINIE